MYLHTSAGAESKLLLSSLFGGGNIYRYISIPLVGRHKALVCLPCLIFFIVRRMSGTKREREGKNMKALVSMLLVQVFLTGVELLSRVVLVQGTFIFALLTYRHIVATICIIPFALYFERYNTNTFISFN